MNTKFLSLLLVLGLANSSSLFSMKKNGSKQEATNNPPKNIIHRIKLATAINYIKTNKPLDLSTITILYVDNKKQAEVKAALKALKNKKATEFQINFLLDLKHTINQAESLVAKKTEAESYLNEALKNAKDCDEAAEKSKKQDEVKKDTKKQAEEEAKSEFRRQVAAGVLAAGTAGLLRNEIVAGVKIAANTVKNTTVAVANGVVNTAKEIKNLKLTKKTGAVGAVAAFMVDRAINVRYPQYSPFNRLCDSYNSWSEEANYKNRWEKVKFLAKVVGFPKNTAMGSYDKVKTGSESLWANAKEQVSNHPFRLASGAFTVAAIYTALKWLKESKDITAVQELYMSFSNNKVDEAGNIVFDAERARATVITAITLNDATMLESLKQNDEIYAQLTNAQKELLDRAIEEIKAN